MQNPDSTCADNDEITENVSDMRRTLADMGNINLSDNIRSDRQEAGVQGARTSSAESSVAIKPCRLTGRAQKPEVMNLKSLTACCTGNFPTALMRRKNML